MRRIELRILPLLLALAASWACKTSEVGTCTTSSDCAAGATCDTTQSPPVCVVPDNGCFPACPSGKACQNAQCVDAACNPPCDTAHVCDLTTATCTAATAPEVKVTGPAANASVGATIHATATARAPGGVTSLHFELRRNSTVLAQSAPTSTPAGSDPANFAGIIDASAVAQGPAELFAVIAYAAGSLDSAPVAVVLDATAPTITMVTDGRSALVGPGATVTVKASIDDGTDGSGTLGTSASLTFLSGTHAAVTSTVASDKTATFTFAVDDTLCPDGQNATVTFRIDGVDGAGNAATLSGDPKQVLLIDRAGPTATINTDLTWHAQLDTVAISGTVADLGGSLQGGATKFEVLINSAVIATGTPQLGASTTTSGTWASAINLAQQTVPAIEGPFAFSVRFTDRLGNQRSFAGALNVDNLGPRITQITVTTAPDWDGGPGYYKSDGGNLGVSAFLQDQSGFDAGTVCLRVEGESGACPHAGATLDGGTWTFTLPRPGMAQQFDGTAPLAFYISAADGVSGSLPPQNRGSHQGSADGGVYFDNTPPTITIPADPTVYPRDNGTGGNQSVPAIVEIDDFVGVDDGGTNRPKAAISGNGGHFYAAQDGGSFTFNLDGHEAIAAGTEGPATFVVTAVDRLGNTATASGTRTFDDAAPTVNLTLSKQGVPTSGAGIQYPAAMAGTGWDGGSFIYSDTVRISGTITDISGVSSSTSLRVNGIATNGTTSTGPLLTLGCSGGTTCTVDTSFALNDLTKVGEFHTGTSTANPAGNLTFAFGAYDNARQPSGQPATHVFSSTSTVRVSRLWWFATLGLTQVIGLGVHPSGDVIATGVGAGDTLFSLRNAGPIPDTGSTATSSINWSWGIGTVNGGTVDVPFGAINDSPAIGAGDKESASIYVASSAQSAAASISVHGVANWLQDNLGAFYVAPAVATVKVKNASNADETDEVVFLPDGENSSTLWELGAFADASMIQLSSASANTVDLSAPLFMSDTSTNALGAIYYGTDNGTGSHEFSKQVILNTGPQAAATPVVGSTSADSFSPLSDGNIVFIPDKRGSSSSTGRLRAFVQPFSAQYTISNGRALTCDAVFEGTTGTNILVGGDSGGLLSGSPAASTSTFTTRLSSLGSNVQQVLLGSNAHTYVTLGSSFGSSASLAAYKGTAVSWYWNPNGSLSYRIAMDCAGHLFVANGNEVRAFITDDNGLADTPWPSARKDSRNSGNATLTTRYGSRVANGTCTQ
ncbi:MAG: hypothetical protein JST92_10140 [Deltaproteobacteria bacterium]|nr:hypothetical protein [Deltaproteobacteria bacterium]